MPDPGPGGPLRRLRPLPRRLSSSYSRRESARPLHLRRPGLRRRRTRLAPHRRQRTGGLRAGSPAALPEVTVGLFAACRRDGGERAVRRGGVLRGGGGSRALLR
ncbi:hypothetical protein, partial [Streptomyces sp. BR123]|uniref:hypothetical protein n=1 Tax=Streptomyces sp. BR123 TaxID=2749828 RepID=UPI001C4FC5DC